MTAHAAEVIALPPRPAPFWVGRAPGARSAGEDMARMLRHDCIEVLDADGALLSISDTGCDALELGAAHWHVGRPWVLFWPEAVRPAIAAYLDRVRDGDMVGFVAARPTALGGRRMWDVNMTMIPGSEAEGPEILVASRGALGPPTL